MHILKPRILVLLASAVFLHCEEPVRTHNWFAMDSNMSVSLYGHCRVPEDTVLGILAAETGRLDRIFSDFLASSALSGLKGNAGDTVRIDSELHRVLAFAASITQGSQGAFDVTLHDLKVLWGIGSGRTPRIPDTSEIAAAMKGNPNFLAAPPSDSNLFPLSLLPGNRAILRRDQCQLDLGAIAKGYIVDRLHFLLDSLGCPNHILMAGGDMRLGGRKQAGAWTVGIRHPRAKDSLIGRIRLESPRGVSTSGDYERFFESDGIHYHHIFDPRTGRPARGTVAVTVVADSSLVTDALSTALFVLGPARGAELARRNHAAAVWFRDRPEGGLCASPMAELKPVLELHGVPECGGT